MKIYSIEGNIGSGKTMLWESLEEVASRGGEIIGFVPESAMSVFEHVPHLLEDYYNEPAKHCEDVTTRIIRHGCEELQRILRCCDKVVLDSSLLATRNVFLPSAIERNLLGHDVAQGMIETIDDFLVGESIEITPLWLSTNPKTCLERTKRRARPGETAKITLDFIERHHDLYWQWLGMSNSLDVTESNPEGLLRVLF